MGITLRCLETLDSAIDRMQWKWPGIRMAELGNQHLHFAGEFPYSTPAKWLFDQRGAEHVSIDLNARDEAIPLDLSQPFESWGRDAWAGYFDVVTNFGTAEHVTDIYQCLRTMHKLCRVGGIIVHAWPECGSWAGHGFHYINVPTVYQLGYEVMYAERHPHESDWLVHAVLLKQTDDFPANLNGVEIYKN